MKKNSAKSLVIFLSLFFASCAAKNEQPQIRIVDMQGRARPVAIKTPELNVQALAAQGVVHDNKTLNSGFAAQKSVPNRQMQTNADFGDTVQQTLQSTQQTTQQPVWQKPEQTQPAQFAENNAIIAGGATNEKEQTIEYDLSEVATAETSAKPEKHLAKKPSKKLATKESRAKSVKQPIAGKKKFFAQVGSFTNQGNAENLLAKMKKFHSGKVEIVEGEKTIYRVLLGPFPNKIKANAMVKKITTSGHDAILVRSE